ncbi:Hypothetical protein, putative, partial [Bodo saltans]
MNISACSLPFTFLVKVLLLLLGSQLSSPVVAYTTETVQYGCPIACCPYACNCYDYGDGYTYCYDTCYSCECFTATSSSYGGYWSGCSGKVLYVVGGATGEIINGAQSSLQYTGAGAVGQIDGSASVGTVLVSAASTQTTVLGSVSTFNGGNQGGTFLNVVSGTVGSVVSFVSGSIYVSSGAGIGTAVMTSSTVSVSGYITNMYPTASTVNIYSGGSSNFIQGYGAISVASGGYVNVMQVTASSSVTVAGGVSTLSLTGGSTSVSILGGTVTNIVVGTSGNTFTMSSGSFSSMTFTVAQNAGTTLTAYASSLGCIVFQSTVANVPMTFTASTFTSSGCHFIEFDSTVSSSSVTANGGCAHSITSHSAIYGYSTFSNFNLRWDTSQLTVVGSANGFYLQAATVTSIVVTNCVSPRIMQIGGSAVAIPSGGSQISFLVGSSTITSTGNTFQCGSATTVTVSLLSSSFLAATTSVYFTSSVMSLWMYAQSSTISVSSGSILYVASNMASSSVTSYSSSFNSPVYGVFTGGAMTSSSFTVTASSGWYSGAQGIYAGSANTINMLVTQSSYWTTASHGFYVAGTASSIGITMLNSATWTNSGDGFACSSTVNTLNVLVQLQSAIYSVGPNVYIGGSATSVSITVTSTGSSDVTRITSSGDSNFYCNTGATNLGIYITGAGALISSPSNNLYVTGASSSNVDMTVTSSATVTAGSRNWYFTSTAPLVGTSNEILISSQSVVHAQVDNFLMQSTGSLWLTVTGSSFLTAVTDNNLYVTGDCGMLRVAFTSSTITAAVNNIFVGGSILSDLTPNYVYMTTATMS